MRYKTSTAWSISTIASMLLMLLLAACGNGTGATPAPTSSAPGAVGTQSQATAASPGASSTQASPAATTSGNQGKAVTLRLERFFGECGDQVKGVTDPSKGTDECTEVTILTNKWNAEHPQCQIDTSVVDPGQYYTRLSAEFASGAPPDIAIMHGAEIAGYASRGVLQPVGDEFAKVGIDPNDFVTAAKDYVTYQGKIYAMPWDVHTMLWYINVDLFKKAGLVDAQGNPKLPQNKDEFIADARIMKQKTGKQFVQAQTIDADLGTDWNLDAFVWQQGGSVYDESANKPTIDTPEAKNGIQFWQSLIKNGYTSPDVKDTNSMFFNGEVASLINGTWAVNQFNTQVNSGQTAFKKLAIAPFPTIYKQPAAWANSHTWVLPVQSNPDPAKHTCALQVLKFLYDNDLGWSRTGHLAARKSVIASDAYKSQPFRADYAKAAEIAHAMPPVKKIDAFQSIMREEILGVYLGQKSPDQALSDAQNRVQETLQSP